ncbi:TPA: hypothetical protein WI931_000966 [Neisseria meningitidis]|nr:hypothetical protein [Neisseria sp. Marseille-Q1983]
MNHLHGGQDEGFAVTGFVAGRVQVAVDVEAGVVFSAEGFGRNGNNAAYTASDGIQAQSGAHYPALPLKEGVEAEKNIGKYRLKYVQTAFAYWDRFGRLRKISVLTACSGRQSKRRRQVLSCPYSCTGFHRRLCRVQLPPRLRPKRRQMAVTRAYQAHQTLRSAKLPPLK